MRASILDFDTPNGHFFTQTNGQGGAGDVGYEVSDDEGIPFWSQFEASAGVDTFGYPVSNRFFWNGTVVQAFQKVVMQWQIQTQSVSFVNIFDELSAAGKDDWLIQTRWVPKPADWSSDQGRSWEEIVQSHQALLDQNPAIRAAYFDVGDPITTNGLPMSAQDFGIVFVVRAQRAVFQQWQQDTPWASAGEVTIANGGDIFKEAGLIPADATLAVSPEQLPANAPAIIPANGSQVVVLDPGHGGGDSGAIFVCRDGFVLEEKDVNLQIALRVATLLKDAGYRPVLTRDSDTLINVQGLDLNGDGRVNVDDDLQARVDIANDAQANVLVSIHNNGYDDFSIYGTEVYYDSDRPFTARNLQFAAIVQRNLVAAIRGAGYETADRGIKTDTAVLAGEHFYLLGPNVEGIARPSQMPGLLGESLFVTNPRDAAQLRSATIIEAIAQGYAVAIAQFLALPA